jgi:hypothetical protein
MYFKQTPRKHIDGRGCKKCNNISRIEKLHNRDNLEKFIEKASKIHRDLFSYEKVVYVNSLTKVEIYCKSCDKYYSQSPANHLSGKGCINCRNKNLGNNTRYSYDFFLDKLSNEQISKYTYSDFNFKKRFSNEYHKMLIFCKKCKSDFLTNIASHLQGHGCPNCNRNGGVNEIKIISEILNSFNFTLIKQYRPKFLKRQSIDIFIPLLNLGIEYQGIQHFKPVDYFGGESGYIETLERDIRKNKLCKENKVELLYFTYKKEQIPNDYQFEVISEIENLLKIIKNKLNENEIRLERHINSSFQNIRNK